VGVYTVDSPSVRSAESRLGPWSVVTPRNFVPRSFAKARAVLPLAALLAATMLGGCIIDRGYPGYGPPGHRGGYDEGPSRPHDNRQGDQNRAWPNQVPDRR